jgi:3-oxoacyl-[acyl-carrier protein] reductase
MAAADQTDSDVSMPAQSEGPGARPAAGTAQPKRLAGKKALVTGASRGIGRAIALALAREGASVAINYRSHGEDADHVASLADDMGVGTWQSAADISDIAQVQRMKEQMTKYFGPIDILVNNAGINVDHLFAQMSAEDWNSVLRVNLDGVFNCINTFRDDFLAGGEGKRIINITSIVGQMGNIGQVNYAASKAGVIGMTKSLAKEMARYGVTVNAIAPGFIETDMVAGIPDNVKEKILKQIPMRRFGLPEEVAEGVVFLSLPTSSYITGHVLNVNGGMYV